ncbi:MAG: dipeptide ABC transporter ATP-binding protein [Clostridiales bacterium]|nr:dipeptide ABC transporter ATP-binding protein [Clostridiales bacterium]
MANEPLVRVQDLKMYFDVDKKMFSRHKRTLKAVDGVSFGIERGRTFGLVGESGCGKTTVGRTIVRLYTPTDGAIYYDGKDIAKLDNKQIAPYRRKMQMIFQDPYASLDPRMTVGDIIAEPIRAHKLYSNDSECKERVRELIATVGLKPDHIARYPHEFSGGQRQRIGIARALASNPEFIVCDEPISALDVSIQAQVVNELEELQASLGLTYLFVSHDLSMVRHISHDVGVMYLGHMVEMAPVEELFAHMQHPYTRALLSAVPIADPDLAAKSQRIVIQGDVPTPIDPPSGCPFRTRCPYAKDICAEQRPEMRDIGGGHYCACHMV